MSTLYKPQKITDLFFNKDEATKLKEYTSKGQHSFIYGSPGIGKTTSVYVVAQELGMHVVETNGSDDRTKSKLENILAQAKMMSFIPVIFFIDECDGITAWSPIEELLVKSKHPVILACNDAYKVPDSIKNRCNQIKYLDPTTQAVADLVRKVSTDKGIKPHYELLAKGTDFRTGLLSGLYGGTRHERSDKYKDIERLFKEGIIPPDLDKDTYIWLLDNAHKFYQGAKLIEFILMLSRIDLIRKEAIVDRNDILAQYRSMRSDRITYPNYLKRGSVLRRRKKDE